MGPAVYLKLLILVFLVIGCPLIWMATGSRLSTVLQKEHWITKGFVYLFGPLLLLRLFVKRMTARWPRIIRWAASFVVFAGGTIIVLSMGNRPENEVVTPDYGLQVEIQTPVVTSPSSVSSVHDANRILEPFGNIDPPPGYDFDLPSGDSIDAMEFNITDTVTKDDGKEIVRVLNELDCRRVSVRTDKSVSLDWLNKLDLPINTLKIQRISGEQLSTIHDLRKLEILDLTSTQVANIAEFLPDGLMALTIKNSSVSDLSDLARCSSLRYLDASGLENCEDTVVWPDGSLDKLRYLDLSGSAVVTLKLPTLSKLEVLKLEKTKALKTLELATQPGLKTFHLSSCIVEGSLSLTGFKNLGWLVVSSNTGITSLTLTNANGLFSAMVANNPELRLIRIEEASSLEHTASKKNNWPNSMSWEKFHNQEEVPVARRLDITSHQATDTLVIELIDTKIGPEGLRLLEQDLRDLNHSCSVTRQGDSDQSTIAISRLSPTDM